jgi:hypothetical protein
MYQRPSISNPLEQFIWIYFTQSPAWAKGKPMKHIIKFSSAKELLLWLIDNNIDELPVDLTLHLGE